MLLKYLTMQNSRERPWASRSPERIYQGRRLPAPEVNEEGERLDTRPDLAGTYMEIGKRFLEKKSKNKELNGINAEGYIEKARTMFQDMDLQWDLDELSRVPWD